MAKKTIAALKEYFKVGKRPTENQFGDLIDSYVHVDESSEYSTVVEFPANYQVGDYVEFLQFEPSSAGAGGFFEVSIAYTRNNTASAATHIAAVSHANPDVWKECGTVNKNNYVDGSENNNLTVDMNGGTCRFRLRAVHTYGDPNQTLKVFVKIRSVNKNDNWIVLDNRGNTIAAVPIQPMTNEWNLWVGSLRSSENAKIGLKVNMDGNVGIGTATPDTKLNVVHENSYNQNATVAKFTTTGATGGSNILSLSYHNKANLELNSGFSGLGRRYGDYFDFNIENDNSYDPNFGSINFVTSQNVQMTVRPGGNVGIGTVNPLSKLDVRGNILAGRTDATEGINAFAIRYENGSVNNWGSLRSGAETYMSYGAKADNTTAYGWLSGSGSYPSYKTAVTTGNDGIRFLSSAYGKIAQDSPVAMSELMRIAPNGNVGIGTQNPDQKLAVKGKIHAEDVIVDPNVPADYVFQKYFDGQSPIKPDYQMPTIRELESFVKENKHLPDIPSAEKMSQDGVNLGDLQMKLLQKIEEMSLYIISLNQEIDILKSK
ncbi:hypothetical protein H5J24_04375 [Chryseobacterium capnotolerans]|uniref:hypothetical protein n=1 Tax=Chryseobacterium TaxID=59732 RepID=UPI00083B89E8|nr:MULTISPECIES: hypothetical protein [Chryseobacterium]UHO39355.1 hypothetical protein H5J24_04375 [Chryseobacterium capnotolerans]